MLYFLLLQMLKITELRRKNTFEACLIVEKIKVQVIVEPEPSTGPRNLKKKTKNLPQL